MTTKTNDHGENKGPFGPFLLGQTEIRAGTTEIFRSTMAESNYCSESWKGQNGSKSTREDEKRLKESVFEEGHGPRGFFLPT